MNLSTSAQSELAAFVAEPVLLPSSQLETFADAMQPDYFDAALAIRKAFGPALKQLLSFGCGTQIRQPAGRVPAPAFASAQPLRVWLYLANLEQSQSLLISAQSVILAVLLEVLEPVRFACQITD